MTVRPLRSDADLRWALAEIDAVIDAEPGTPQDDRLMVLTDLVEAYERRHHAIAPLEPEAFLRAFMSEQGMRQVDLAQVIGSRSRASEVLSGKRSLTLDMIRAIHRAWGVPLGALVGQERVKA